MPQIKIELIGGSTYDRTWAQSELRRLEQLGVFGNDNDFNTPVNPDIKPKDFTPQEEDFIRVPFRLLSATTVAAGTFRATKFSASVLRKAMGKFVNVPIFPNHSQEVGNELGIIESVKFVSARTTKENPSKKITGGLKIPSGVEGILKIDAKANPKTARSLLGGSITGLSVTVDFEWEPSHKLQSDQTLREWQWTVGEIHEDGTMITRNVTTIRDIFEASLVWLGADPFAKAIDEDGQLVNVDESHAVEFDSLSFVPNEESSYNVVADAEKESYLSSGKYEAVYSFRRELGTGLGNLEYEKEQTNKKIDTMKPEVLALLLIMFSVDKAESITEEMIKGFKLVGGDRFTEMEGFESKLETVNTSLETEKGKVTDKTSELVTANTDKDALQVKVDAQESVNKIHEALTKILDLGKEGEGDDEKAIVLTLEIMDDKVRGFKKGAESYEAHVAQIRKETLKLYSISAGDNVDEAITKMIEGAKVEELQALAKTYGAKAIGSFTGTCKDCNSTNITLQSSVTGSEGNEGDNDIVEDTSSAEYLSKKYRKNSMNVRIEDNKKD